MERERVGWDIFRGYEFDWSVPQNGHHDLEPTVVPGAPWWLLLALGLVLIVDAVLLGALVLVVFGA